MNEREEAMMNMLWESEKPMTSADLAEFLDKALWNRAAIFRVIKSLLKKGLIEECGTELRGKQWTRRFKPAMSKEEYMAQYLVDRGIDEKSLGRIAAAVVSRSSKNGADDARLIGELEAIIQGIRERVENAD